MRSVTFHRLFLLPILGLFLAPPLGAQTQTPTYDLVFDPAGPIVATEGDIVNVDVSVSGGCSPFSVDWEAGIQAVTADGSDVGTIMPDPVGFSDVGPTVGVQVPLVDDTLIEDTESFFLVLTPISPLMTCSNPATEPAQSEYSVEIQILDNDDAPEPRIVVGDVTVRESAGAADVKIEVLDPRPGDVYQVTVDTGGGTATPGTDYADVSGLQVPLDGSPPSAVVEIPIVNDDLEEQDETFLVKLSNPVNATLEDPDAEVLVVDDDRRYQISVFDAEVGEGDSVSRFVKVKVEAASPLGRAPASRVDYATRDLEATAGEDYEAASGTLEFPSGKVEQTIEIEVFGDADFEGDERFAVDLSNPQDATLADETAEVTIVDNEEPEDEPLPQITIDDVTVDEGDEGPTPARFRLSLSEASEEPVTVDVSTADDSATVADADYRERSGTVTFEPGETVRFFPVPVVGDTRVEADEVFRLVLSRPDGATLARDAGQCLIVNDDDEGDGGDGGDDGGDGEEPRAVVRLLPSRGPVLESSGAAIFAVERLGSARGAVRVAVRTVRGSARPREDFEPVRRVLQWADGESGPVELEVPLVDDQVVEPDEEFGVELVEAQGAQIGDPATVRQTVVDDDRPMDLEPISDLEQEAPVRTELVLEARVVRDDGAPVEGAPVRWAARGRASLDDDEVTRSGEGGVVRQTLRLGRIPGPAQVQARLVGTDSTLEFRIRVVGDLDRTVGDQDGEDRDVADILDDACADEEEGSRFREACEYLFGIEDPAARALALEALTPRQALPHQRQALRAPRNQVRNVSARLTALRGGMVRSAFDQLALSVRGEGLSLGPLQEAIAGALADGTPSSVSVHQGDGPEHLRADPRMEEKVALALRRAAGFEPVAASGDAEADAPSSDASSDPVRGGAASANSPHDGPESGDGDDGFDYGGESPWGFFFNGRLSFGDAPRIGRNPGFDFETQGITAGVDRRIGTDWVLGVALGYTSSETEIERRIGRLDLEGQSLSLYATYFTDRWYVDGVFTYGENEYDVNRVVVLPRPFRGNDRLVATGSPDATQTALNLGFGYDFRLGDAGTVSGFLRAHWTRAEIDSFTETGALLFNLQYDEQELDSLLGEIGAEVSYPFSFSWGVLQPLLRVALLHEFEDDPDVLRARFALTRLDRRFRLEFERPDRDFINVAVGATATFPHSWAAFLQYDVDLEREDLDLYTVSGGFRFQF